MVFVIIAIVNGFIKVFFIQKQTVFKQLSKNEKSH